MFNWIKSKALAVYNYVTVKAKAIVAYFSKKPEAAEEPVAQATEEVQTESVFAKVKTKVVGWWTTFANFVSSLFTKNNEQAAAAAVTEAAVNDIAAAAAAA